MESGRRSRRDSAVRAVSDAGARLIEPLKWLALAIMLAEHAMRYVAGELPPWLYAAGRVAFPLFAFALALGLRMHPCGKLGGIIARMLVWAAIAQATIRLVDVTDNRLNVLFTFALGVAAAYAMGCIRQLGVAAVGLGVIGAASWWCEFGPPGVAFVAGCVTLGRAGERPIAAWIAVLLLLALLAIPNGNHYALAAVPAALLVAWSQVRLPRLRGVFYWTYALQFLAYAGARELLN
jgi:hypothetical protein